MQAPTPSQKAGHTPGLLEASEDLVAGTEPTEDLEQSSLNPPQRPRWPNDCWFLILKGV